MSTIERFTASAARLCALVGEHNATAVTATLADEALLAGLCEVSEARKMLDLLDAAFSAEVEKRSDRGLGVSGLAQRKGHRTGTALVQHLTGRARPDVDRATRAGRDLAAFLDASTVPDGGLDGAAASAASASQWFAPLTGALQTGALSREQYDAIRRNLGEPPVERYPDFETGLLAGAWRDAAARLIEEAADSSVEDLRSAARLARDTLDPVGTRMRFDERFDSRLYRTWIDENGQHNARIRYDDDGAAWMKTIMSAALRPRRGPRFVEPGQRREVDSEVRDDPRSNEQLQYDTLMAILRTGAHADPAQAFGDRQPGIRIVVTKDQLDDHDEHGGILGVGHLEETGQSIPGSMLEVYLCNTATKTVTVDSCGNPLDVGREKRLFTPKQRVALAMRDGGCVWCGAEPSRCEAHHINQWCKQHGRTDVADGVLLCRNCHMRLHNQGWRITREGDTYWLHAPPDARGRPSAPPRRLWSRSLLRFERNAGVHGSAERAAGSAERAAGSPDMNVLADPGTRLSVTTGSPDPAAGLSVRTESTERAGPP